MRSILLVSLFGFAVSTQAAISLPSQPAVTGAMTACDKSKLNDGKPYQWVDVFIRTNGTIVWNGTPITKEQFERYIVDDAKGVSANKLDGTMVYTLIRTENDSPQLADRARALKTDALMQGAVVPECTP